MTFVLQQVRVVFVFADPQSLDFCAQTLFGLHFPLGFKNVDVGVDNALVVRGDRGGQRVEVKVIESVFGLPTLVQLAADGRVEIAHIQLVPRSPAVSLVSVERAFQGLAAVLRGVQAVGRGEACAQLGAILAAQFAALGNGVENLGTCTGFACDDRGVGVEGRRQVVGVLLCDRGNEVDGQVKQAQIPIRSEAHVVDHFGGEQHAQSFLAVPQGGQEGLSIAECVAVVCAGVVDFSGVFGTRGPTLADGVDPVGPRANILWHGKHKAVHAEGRTRLEFADETGRRCHFQRLVFPAFDQRVEVGFHVDRTYDARPIDEAVVKVEPLLAVDEFGLHTLDGLEDESEPIHGVVNAQVAFLVRAKHQAASKLVVEVAHGDVHPALGVVVAGKSVPHATSAETTRKTNDRVQVAFVAHPGAEIALVVEDVGEGVVACFCWRNHGADE